MWSLHLADTMTGLLGEPIDIPHFSWALSLTDSSLVTGDKMAGVDELTSLQLPWTSVPAATPQARSAALQSYKRAIVLLWDGVPLMYGIIGSRTDTYDGTSFSALSIFSLLKSRILTDDSNFGKGTIWAKDADYSHEGDQEGTVTSVTRGDKTFTGSLRSICCQIGRELTDLKPAGQVPIDWQYLNEGGRHTRTYYNFNVQNNDGQKLLKAISEVTNGIDMRWVPYMADKSHVRLRFEAGTDSEPYIGQRGIPFGFHSFRGGGNLSDIKVAHQGATMRVYGTGAGHEEAMLCHKSEDLRLCSTQDPLPLIEMAKSNSDWETPALVASHTDAVLDTVKFPLVQISGVYHLRDRYAPQIGELYPGDMVDVTIEDFPSLPSRIYRLRVAEMRGDSSDAVEILFDPIKDPIYS